MKPVWMVALFLLSGCGDGGGAPAPTAPACALSLDSLAGSAWVMHEAQADGKTYKENVLARMRFEDEGGELITRYTVGSLSDVYDFECVKRTKEGAADELYCAEKERAADWCQALMVFEAGSCTKKALRELGIEKLSDDELNEEIKKAKETVKKYRGTDRWDHFVLNNNSLGNKLQGRLYIKVDQKRCRLSVSDMYFTIFDGKGLEDTNPVGINPFVETKEEFMYEHCNDGFALAALKTQEEPEDWSKVKRREEHEAGKEIFYHYASAKEDAPGVKAEEGCVYTFDTFAQWRTVATNKTAPISEDRKTKGKIDWRTSHVFQEDDIYNYNNNPVGVFHMSRYKTCKGGEREKIDTVCNASIIRTP